jgi:bla regulator protein blaR1
MKTPLLNQWFSGDAIKAICWTLIHSLWMGLIIALLCGIVVAATRKSAAALRYRLLCSLLVLFVCAIGVTYYFESGSTPVSQVEAIYAGAAMNFQDNVVVNQVNVVRHQTLFGSAQAFLNQNINIIFAIWLLFFVLKSLKMIGGLLYIQRIRNYKTSDVTNELKCKVDLLSREIGITRVVRLVQSELVKVPVAIGWLKPMILLPAGIALQLSPEQLNNILWHELAHIRRRDYLVNILQGLVETVFFFNPGLLWLSSLIRAEREACCDDMVLSRTNCKSNYLEALLSFGHGEFSQARYAMSIGSGNQLRDRLKRMVNQENKRLSVSEKFVLAIGLLLLTAFTTISKDNPIINRVKKRYVDSAAMEAEKGVSVHDYPMNEKQRVADTVPEYTDKRTVTTADTSIHFTSVLFKNNDADLKNADINAIDDSGNKYHLVVVDGNITSMEINGAKVAEEKLTGYDFILRNIGRELATKRHMSEADQVNARIAKAAAHPNFDKMKTAVKLRDSLAIMQTDVLPKYMQSSIDAKQHLLKQIEWRKREDSIRYNTQLNRAKRVIADLVAENVVPNEEAITWFGLTENELIVNGNKQPEILHLRLMHKYDIHKDYGLFYGPVKITGTGVFVGDEADNRTYPLGNAQAAIERQKIVSDRLRDMHYRAKEKMFDEDVSRANVSADKEQQQEQKLKKNLYVDVNMKTAITGVINDLVDEHIIKDKSELSFFNLTNSELIVNGKKLPEEIHQKLKNKYFGGPYYRSNSDIVDDPNFGLHFNAKNGTRGIGITEKSDSPW